MNKTSGMSRFAEVYERLRPLIIWLGLGELTWLGYWLLSIGDSAPGHVTTAVVWVAAMLAWMALVINLANRGVYLKHTRWFANLVGLPVVWLLAGVVFGAKPGAAISTVGPVLEKKARTSLKSVAPTATSEP